MQNVDEIIESGLKRFELDANYNEIIKQNLKSKLENFCKQYNINFEDNDAIFLASINICLENELNILRKLEELNNFEKSYKRKVFRAILFGIILPILLTIFVFELEYKLIILIYIIFSIIISSFYIIVLEYIDYYKRKELKIKK